MNYLKLPFCSPVPINKSYFTVGSGVGFDALVDGEEEKLFFAIQTDGEKSYLIPGNEKIRLNGKTVSSPIELHPCDQLSFKGNVAVFLDHLLSTDTNEDEEIALRCLGILQRLALDLESENSLRLALHQVLKTLVQIAGAESGHLISELEDQGHWELVASVGDNAPGIEQRRALVSNTIINEAIQKREPIHFESIVGHPWQEKASIMDAKLFSIACLPLIVGKRIFGCVYLYTRTPGHSIKKESLKPLGILATQAGLLLASQAQLKRTKKENAALRGNEPQKKLLFNDKDPNSPMTQMLKRATKLAKSDLNLIIVGETGTGKELMARQIHERSCRASSPFIPVNCGAIPPSLMESTLFYSRL